MKALLLNSSRGDWGRFESWVGLEACKGVLPILPVALLGTAGRPLPTVLSACLVVAGLGWILFVYVNAYSSAIRMQRRHAAYMRAVGIDLSLGATLGNAKLWRGVGKRVTFRESLAALRAAQAPEPPAA